ncbi:MAG TPA: hypothetical protein DEP53_04780 [Bacteroidetes bacterium]|nr:hypothetical protein [Bacteroidota bacterium]
MYSTNRPFRSSTCTCPRFSFFIRAEFNWISSVSNVSETYNRLNASSNCRMTISTSSKDGGSSKNISLRIAS